MLADKVRAQAIPCAIGPQTTEEGEGAPICHPREAHTIDLQVVIRMTDRHPVPLYHWFCPMHAMMVCCHWPCDEFNSAIRGSDPSPESVITVTDCDYKWYSIYQGDGGKKNSNQAMKT